MRQYASDRVDLSWFGLDLKTGIAAGTFLQEAKASPRWAIKANGMGGATRMKNPDRSGTITVTVDQESKTHQDLFVLLELDEQLRNVVGPMVMKDNSSGEENVYVNAFILDDPNEVRGLEAATYTWTFGYERKVKVTNTDDVNLVGS